MHAQVRVQPWWAAIVVWGVVNAVNLLQTAGFLSRIYTGRMTLNHVLGGVIIALSLIHISEPTRLLSISYAVFC